MTRGARDSIKPGVQYSLWPDEEGKLILPPPSRAPLSGLALPRLRRSPRVQDIPRSSRRRLLFSLSSLWLKKLAAVSFFGVGESAFGRWLETRIDAEPFQALGFESVISRAGEELGLDREKATGYLLRATRTGGRFHSDGEIVTRRDCGDRPSPKNASAP